MKQATTPRTRTTPIPLEVCGIAQAIDLIGDRWTLLILREALYGVSRFEDFLSDLGCPRSVLSGRLRRLEANGLIYRDTYRDPGHRPRAAYRLTVPARALALPLLALMQWMDGQMREGRAPVTVRTVDGRELQVALLDEAGVVVPLDQIRMTVSVSAQGS